LRGCSGGSVEWLAIDQKENVAVGRI